MNRSSVTVRGSDCDAGAPMKKMPRNVSKQAVTKFRSIVAIRRPTPYPGQYSAVGAESERYKTRLWQRVAWRQKTAIHANFAYRPILLLMPGLNCRSGRPWRVQRRGEFLPEFIELRSDVAPENRHTCQF